MLLSEEKAEELVREWTQGCGGFTIASLLDTPSLLVDDFRFDDLTTSIAYAEALRRTIEGLNALAACPGFDPAVNPAFWRRQFEGSLASQGDRYRSTSSDPDVDPVIMAFLTKDSFRHCAIRLDFSYSQDPAAAASALEICASTSAASRGLRIRDDVLASLADYMVEHPPFIVVEVLVNLPAEDEGETVWVELARMLRDLKDLWSLSGTSTSDRLRVILGDAQTPISFDKTFRDGVDLLCSSESVLELQQLHARLDGSVRYPSGWRELSRLMQWLARQDSLSSLSVEFDKTDHVSDSGSDGGSDSEVNTSRTRFKSTIFSALPHMATLTHWTGVFEASGWMLYALLSRQRRGFTTSLEVKLLPDAIEELNRIKLQPNCLVGLLPEIVQLRMHPEVWPVGTTVVVPDRTILAARPFLDGLDIQTDQAWRLDVVARCGRRLLVVFPGVGFRWVEETAVVERHDWTAPPDDTNPIGLVSLQCVDSNSSQVAAFLAWTGSHLRKLVLGTTDPLDLGEILPLCPQLKELAVINADVLSFVPLVDAYARRECHITKLIHSSELVSRRGPMEGVPEMLMALCDPEHPIATTLECLVTTKPFFPADGFEECIRRLARNRTLQFLYVGGVADPAHRKFANVMLKNQPLRQNAVSRRALHAFLLAIQKVGRRVIQLPHHCQKLVAEFAALRLRRQATVCS